MQNCEVIRSGHFTFCGEDAIFAEKLKLNEKIVKFEFVNYPIFITNKVFRTALTKVCLAQENSILFVSFPSNRFLRRN